MKVCLAHIDFVLRCFGNALGNCILNKEYLLSINKIPKQPTPPIDPAQTKRSHGEPAVEKARFSSLPSMTDTRRTSLEPGVLPSSEVHTPNLPVPESENKGAGSSGDAVGSGEHADPKQLRKLRQQQLQQKFRKEMEARKLQQEQVRTKSEDTELAIGQGGSGGHQGAPASADISTSGLMKPSTFEDCLADNPELWDFTLDGIEEPNGDADSPGLGGRRPSTPGSHCMQTRGKTPHRGPGRPPDGAASHSTGQEQGPSRTHPPDQYHHSTGAAFSPYRQGQHIKRRRLDT